MTKRITGQLGTSASLLGDLELGDFDTDVLVSETSTLSLMEGVSIETLKETESVLALTQGVGVTGGSTANGGNPWKVFPGKMNIRWGLGLLN